MAKETYIGLGEWYGCTISVFVGGSTITVNLNKDTDQESLKKLYDIGHPAVKLKTKDDTSASN